MCRSKAGSYQMKSTSCYSSAAQHEDCALWINHTTVSLTSPTFNDSPNLRLVVSLSPCFLAGVSHKTLLQIYAQPARPQVFHTWMTVPILIKHSFSSLKHHYPQKASLSSAAAEQTQIQQMKTATR